MVILDYLKYKVISHFFMHSFDALNDNIQCKGVGVLLTSSADLKTCIEKGLSGRSQKEGLEQPSAKSTKGI